MVGSGPYVILDNDLKKGESLTLRRRSDYWGEKERYNTGKYNFDEITFTVVTDDLLQFEKFKKGELDYYNIKQPELCKQKCYSQKKDIQQCTFRAYGFCFKHAGISF
jgi:ABC-type oligopeptide transport system substrate-binding subunit